jgi:septum site-determining protein MinD
VCLALLGQRVVAVDADIGLRNLDVVLGLENRVVYDLVDVVEGRCRLRQALIRDKRLSEMYLLPAAQTRDKTAVSPAQMVDICNQLRPDFDYVLIDSPAGIEQGFQNAVAGADEVIIVTTPEVSAVRDADRIIGLVEAGEKGPARLIINRIKPDMVRRGDMLDVSDVLEILRIDLLGIIPEDEHIIVSTNKGTPVAHEVGAPAGMWSKFTGKKRVTSREVAKQRLQLVLIHDRSDISPVMLEALKADLIAVISEHLEIDQEGIEITLSESRGKSRLLATIPILGRRTRR